MSKFLDNYSIQRTLRKQSGDIHQLICNGNSFICTNFGIAVFLHFGVNKDGPEIDQRVSSIIMKYVTHSFSIKQAVHYSQLYVLGRFCQFDYKQKNVLIYNATSPPDYNLQNFNASTYLYAGGCDAVCDEKDVDNLKEVLVNVKKYKKLRNYNHMDLTYGKNTRKDLYNDVLKAMNGERVARG
jgi:hypothetical protein